ncbi:MAG: hypothetical protein ACKPKO_03515, partial [Candidatus Fonsibacter sp.]
RHTQDKVTKAIYLDQVEYASALRTIAHSELSSKKSDEAAGVELHSLYRSLLGAVAFLLLTRIDVAVFVSALQRWGHAPKIIHVKRLNALTKWIQANPKRLVYGPFTARENRQVVTGVHQRVFSDSAFKKEEQTGHCMRGAAYLLCPGDNDDAFKGTAPCHLLDFISRQQRKVVRATFSAELMGACDAVDKGMLLSHMLHEIYTGDCTHQFSTERSP